MPNSILTDLGSNARIVVLGNKNGTYGSNGGSGGAALLRGLSILPQSSCQIQHFGCRVLHDPVTSRADSFDL
jgi:hypothetical protein